MIAEALTPVAELDTRPGRPRRARHPQVLRRRGGAPRRRLHAPSRPGPRAGRPERRRQVHAGQDHRWRLRRGRGHGRGQRRPPRGSGEPLAQARHRDGVPGVQPHPPDVGGRQHPAHPRAAWSPGSHRRPRGRSAGRRGACPDWAPTSIPTGSWNSCRSAPGSWSRSPRPSPRTRASSSSMSRRRPSPRPRRGRSWPPSAA